MYYIPGSDMLDELDREINQILNKNTADKIVVDLRENGGGQINLTNKWYDTLISFGLKTGQLYTITDYDTFSMAAATAMYLKENGNATVVGLPAGGGAPKVADSIKFNLRNSGFEVLIPVKHFNPKNGVVTYPGQIEFYPSLKNNILEPDIKVEADINAYINKTNPVMELIESM